MKTVAVFRSNYLPLSETFVSDHLRTLRRFRPIVLCEQEMAANHRVPVIPSVVWGGRLGQALFRRYGIAPGLHRDLKRSGAGLIHAHFLIDAAIALPFIERTDLPLVVTAHGYDATLTDEAMAETVEGRLLLQRRSRLIKRASYILCVSDFIRDELASRGYPPEKLVTLPLGVDLDKLTPRSSTISGKGILTVGRLVEKKGMHKLIEAYALLPASLRKQHPLTIIGQGPLREKLEQQARDADIDVRFLGGLPRDEVLAHMQAAAIFCLPSIRAGNGDAEGMPIVIMEALAQAIPVAIFDDQPAASLFKAQDAGIAVTAGDANALSVSLQESLSNPERLEIISQNARHLCEEHFSLSTNGERLEALYASLYAIREAA